ncbi:MULTISPECIES: hypothetical protein [Streptomyces]|uniref:Helix-turn-helix domain-containing protein n=1 Tax=Streptomyces doudnae TaxID=3075536 RepID=A0ABD5EQM0_9ACTN|nr:MULTISPECIES: hypothetical protein [unclassified Streptomyces]MDT0435682.1 hypothetical protein [Streptomyces sp. DSM 41981]MYQ62635.1 hypothetical protein [Streptomyces sp. SID4950]SCD41162.1 hypothetical protein GA0115242_1048142 [Streptomyces sp. SolWspMP-5a-2]
MTSHRRPHPKEPQILHALSDGRTNEEIARQLHVGTATAARIRAEHAYPPARPRLTPQEKFTRDTVLLPGGHMVWTGERTQDCAPVITYRGQKLSVRPIAYAMENGRPPVGNVKSACAYPWCVAPECQADAEDRQALRAKKEKEADVPDEVPTLDTARQLDEAFLRLEAC